MTTFSAQTCTGPGVLARYGGSLVLAPSDCPLLDALLELAAEADRDHTTEPGRFLSRKVASLVAQSDDQVTLAIVSALPDGLAVLLAGDVTVTLDDGTLVSGRDATTWVDRIVRDPWTSLTVALDGAGAVEARSDLQGGVVTAAGVRLSATTQEAPTAAAVAPVLPEVPSEVPAFESFSLDAEPEQLAPAPLPVPSANETMSIRPTDLTPVEPEAGGATVEGIVCSRQHFNDPAAVYCAICGISMVHQTHNLVSGLRPPLGVLVVDDGSVHSVDRDYVLGREPDGAPEVAGGTATGLTLDDPDVTMSRVHARLSLVGWEVRLTDAVSANGTFVAPPGVSDWTRLGEGQSAVLTPGTRVALGGRTMVFDSHHKL